MSRFMATTWSLGCDRCVGRRLQVLMREEVEAVETAKRQLRQEWEAFSEHISRRADAGDGRAIVKQVRGFITEGRGRARQHSCS